MDQDLIKKIICGFLILLVNKCPAPQTNVEIVSQTLQTYQAGKTTIEDFIRDAGLVNATFPPPYDVGPNPPPSFLLKCIFKTAAGSPWKIYETGMEGKNYGSESRRTRKYVVGNTNEPIFILAFNKKGELESISPPPNIPRVRLVYSETKAVHDSAPSLSRTNIEVVARTLNTYKVGKTTIENFMLDAHLIHYASSFQTYLNTNPPDEGARYALIARAGSPWVIYKTTADTLTTNGVTVVPARKYLVGDTKKPICTLEFDERGNLANILPEP